MKSEPNPESLQPAHDSPKLSGEDAMAKALRVHAIDKYKENQKAEGEFARVVGALAQIGLKVSFQTVKHIVLVYHSCAIEGCSLTLEETAHTIGIEIIEKLRNEK